MKIILLMIPLIIAAKCEQPTEFNGSQRSPQFHYEKIQLIDGSWKEVISIEKSICRYRGYSVSQDYIGPAGVAGQLPIKKCNLIIGYKSKEEAQLKNLMEYVRQNIGNEHEQIIPEFQK